MRPARRPLPLRPFVPTQPAQASTGDGAGASRLRIPSSETYSTDQPYDRVARAAGRRDLNFPVALHFDWLVRAYDVRPLVDLKNTLGWVLGPN